MNAKQQIIEKCLQEVLGPKKTFTANDRLTEDLGLTSLQLLELISMIEDDFNVLIPLNQAREIKTVAGLYQAAEQLQIPA